MYVYLLLLFVNIDLDGEETRESHLYHLSSLESF